MFDELRRQVNEFSIKYQDGEWLIDTGKVVSCSKDLNTAIVGALRYKKLVPRKLVLKPVLPEVTVTQLEEDGEFNFCGFDIDAGGGEVWAGGNVIGSFEKGDWLLKIDSELYVMPNNIIRRLYHVCPF